MRKQITIGLLLVTAALAQADAGSLGEKERSLWVGAFDQCSYNALGAVLLYYKSATPAFKDRQAFEKQAFEQPLNSTGLGAYYGWAPWTGYMVNTGHVQWAAGAVTDIHAENFALDTSVLPKVQSDAVRVTYGEGERALLRDRLRAKLRQGPVVLWVPYCAALAKGRNLPGNPWQQVKRDAQDAYTDIVPFSPDMTHSITLFARPTGTDPAEEVLVMDCSVRQGIFATDIDTLVSTAAAMPASIRIIDPSGTSIFSRGLKGLSGENYEVAFHQDPTATAPASQPAALREEDPHERAALDLVPAPYVTAVRQALAAAGDNRAQWVQALSEVPADERPTLAFLLAGMPAKDLQHLDKQFVLDDVHRSSTARHTSPWAKAIPDALFLADVAPYANLNEKREAWRAALAAITAPLIAGAQTPGEAALALNAKLFNAVHVQYHPTKRPKPDQSPSESIAAGYASCTGLSILLVDACRSLDIPARIVGTPAWVIPRGDANGNHAGNHTWVEIWDKQWHVLGASEVSPFDHTWFLDNARLAAGSADPLHHIYAASWQPTGIHFPLVWAPDDLSVNALDVTSRYAPQ